MGLAITEKRSGLYKNIAEWLITAAIFAGVLLFFYSIHDVETPGAKTERIKPILLSKGKARYYGNVVQVVDIERKNTVLGHKDIVTVKYDSGTTAKFVLFDAVKSNNIEAM